MDGEVDGVAYDDPILRFIRSGYPDFHRPTSLTPELGDVRVIISTQPEDRMVMSPAFSERFVNPSRHVFEQVRHTLL